MSSSSTGIVNVPADALAEEVTEIEAVFEDTGFSSTYIEGELVQPLGGVSERVKLVGGQRLLSLLVIVTENGAPVPALVVVLEGVTVTVGFVRIQAALLTTYVIVVEYPLTTALRKYVPLVALSGEVTTIVVVADAFGAMVSAVVLELPQPVGKILFTRNVVVEHIEVSLFFTMMLYVTEDPAAAVKLVGTGVTVGGLRVQKGKNVVANVMVLGV